MKEQAFGNRNKLYAIRDELNAGLISYAEAEAQAQPIIDSINKRAKELAKKYGMRPQLVSFRAIMR